MQRKLQKRPRTWHPAELFAQRSGLWEDAKAIDAAKTAEVDSVKGDAARFFVEVCKLKPYSYQLELVELYRQFQFLAVRWPRQTGKSTSIGGLLLQDAWETG